MELKSRILKCKEQISKNNSDLKRLSKENERLFKSLMVMMNTLPDDKKQRYDKELASDGWKKTDYYKKNMKRFESNN